MVLLSWPARSLAGQSVAYVTQAAVALPNAPSASLAMQQAAGGVSSSKGSASVAGVVVDQSGGAVAGAAVSLVDGTGKSFGETISAAHGEYSLDHLPAGTYKVVVKARGFAPSTSAAILLAAGQAFAVPTASLTIAEADTEVQVNSDRTGEAEIEIKAAEQQRVLGIVPNFYESFQYDAAPLNTRQKYKLAFRDTFDPVGFIATGIGAGIEQANNTFAGYGQGAAGYGKRYAALYGDGLFSDLLSHAVFPSLFHQDPRYFYQGTGTIKSRVWHAVSFAFVTRSDTTGRNVPNYSYLAADLVAGSLSNLYYPHADRGAGLVFTNSAIGIAGQAVSGLVDEFILPRFTTHKAGKGQKQTP